MGFASVAYVPAIVTFRASVAPQASTPDPARLLSGQPQLQAWNHYSDPSGQFHAGLWSATRGSWRIQYSEFEFCHLLLGRVALTDQAGRRTEFSAGDSFVIPAGFSGTWEVIEDCRKLYAIFESNTATGG
jgi:uncharacterized cupin superfamily protein